MIAEIYNLPITLEISCPHAPGGFRAMNLEWNARDFIIDNCQSCEFHNEAHNKNFGREVIKDYKKYLEKLEGIDKVEFQKRQELKNQVETLITKDRSKAEVTELSILSLIHSIENDNNRINISKRILEASKLSPTFFGDIALDYLSLLINDNQIGGEILHAIQNVLRTKKTLSSFSIEKLKDAIENKVHIDEVVGVLKFVIDENDFTSYETLLNKIINSLWYKRNVGDPYESPPSYPNSISLLINVFRKNPDLLFKLLNERLKINNKITRINTNYLLQELIITNADAVKPHCETIIKSFELEDDDYEDSADNITCNTLSELYKSDQGLVMSSVESLFSRLSEGAKVEFIRFFEIILLKEKYVFESQKDATKIVEKLLKLVFAKGISKELNERILSILKEISKRRPNLLSNSFDSILGFLIDRLKAVKTFNWYLNELENPNGKISTFNPLHGKSYLDIQSEEMEINHSINKAETIVSNLISKNVPNDGFIKIINIISSLDSSIDGMLKSKLIAIIRLSVKDPVLLANQLPLIYNFLLDTESKEVRLEALKFVLHLIEKHDQLVTHTIINLIKVFLNDSDIGVKGKAIDTFAELTKKFPDQIEQEQINIILSDLLSSYVFIHKKAARSSYKIFPFLTNDQKIILLKGIFAQENFYYKKRDLDYCKELVEILLFLTKEKPKMYSEIVYEYVAKYCDSKDYYTDIDFIKKLSYMRNQNKEFNKVWFLQSLGFLSRTKPEHYNPSFDSRKHLFVTMYKLPKPIIVEQLEEIKKISIQKIQNEYFPDVFELFAILGYFRLYEVMWELSTYFENTVQKNKSTESATSINELYRKIADLEIRIEKQQIDKNFINSFKNR